MASRRKRKPDPAAFVLRMEDYEIRIKEAELVLASLKEDEIDLRVTWQRLLDGYRRLDSLKKKSKRRVLS